MTVTGRAAPLPRPGEPLRASRRNENVRRRPCSHLTTRGGGRRNATGGPVSWLRPTGKSASPCTRLTTREAGGSACICEFMPLVAGRLPAGGARRTASRAKRRFCGNGLFFRSISGAAGESCSHIVAEVAAAYHLETRQGIGLFGFSAGGAAALLALMESEVPVAAAVIVNAPMSVEQNVENWERQLGHQVPLGWLFARCSQPLRRRAARRSDRPAQDSRGTAPRAGRR